MDVNGHGHDDGAADHAHVSSPVGDGHPSLEEEACPGCAGHQAMALTCLAALILLGLGWLLRGPIEWRGVRLRRILLLAVESEPLTTWVRLPLSLTELSVSRT